MCARGPTELSSSWIPGAPKSVRKNGRFCFLLALEEAGVPNIPTVVCGGTLDGDVQRALTAHYADEEWARRTKAERVEVKEHTRYMMREIGIFLHFTSSSCRAHFCRRSRRCERFVDHCYPGSLFPQSITAHQAAYDAGWLHRDISDGNILLYRIPQEGGEPTWGGPLIDREYAILITETRRAQHERTARCLQLFMFVSC